MKRQKEKSLEYHVSCIGKLKRLIILRTAVVVERKSSSVLNLKTWLWRVLVRRLSFRLSKRQQLSTVVPRRHSLARVIRFHSVTSLIHSNHTIKDAVLLKEMSHKGYCWNGYSKIWWDTSWHINRYKHINDTLLFRQRITAGSATDL